MEQKPIPVIKNCYNLIKNADGNSQVLSCSKVNHSVGMSKSKKNKSTKAKHKILIVGDSHT